MNRMYLLELVFLLAIAPLALSQDATSHACPDSTPGTLGCEPVEWSRLQEPVPLPEPDASVPPSDQQPDPQPGESAGSQTQQNSLKTIVGVIVRDGKSFVLKARDNTVYELDDQSKAGAHQDNTVRVVGRLDSAGKTLQIASIE